MNTGMTAAAETAPLSDRRPLYVDLDGTLSTSDSLYEGLAEIVRKKPEALPNVALKALKGRPALKEAVFEEAPDLPGVLPLNEKVLSFIEEARAEGRAVILATAASPQVARAVAERTGLFDGVLASEGAVNLKGERKLRAIEADAEARTGDASFDYIGDSPADRPIWARAGRALVVSSTQEGAASLAGPTPVEAVIDAPKGGLRDAVKAMRVHQWVKNALVFVPLVLSHQILDPLLLSETIAVLIAMSFCASATYIWNDILDLPSDRQHRTKKNRPIAAGRLPIARGLGLSAVLLGIASLIALLAGGLLLLATLYGYVVLTLGYSLLLKRKLLVDAMVIGGLFAYRILLGAVATGIPVSDWLLAFSVFFFLGLALAKRYVEIDASEAPPSERISGRGYRPEDRGVILNIGVATSYIAIIVLSLYTTSPDVKELYANPQFLWGTSLALIYWVGRVWVLAHRRELNDDPIVFAVKDRNSYICAAACGASLLLAGPQ